MSMKHLASAITISPRATSLPASTKPTGTGVEIQLSIAEQEQAIALLVSAADPLAVDKRLITSLELLTGFRVEPIQRTRYLKDETVDIQLQGYKIRCDDKDKCIQAIKKIKQSLTPLPAEEIAQRLTVLAALVVKPTGESSSDHKIRIKAITSQLVSFPADIVIRAIDNVGKATTFWPAYAEFHKHIEYKLKTRYKLLEAFEKQLLTLDHTA